MTFIEALFALFISTAGVPGGCEGPLVGLVPGAQATCEVVPRASNNQAQGQQSKQNDETLSKIELGAKRHRKISNGF